MSAGAGERLRVDHQFGFNLSGAFGQTLVVDSSTNLLNWTTLTPNTAGDIPWYFIDPASTNRPWQFCRARLLDD